MIIPFLISSILYTSPQFCTEFTEELNAAVVREEITQDQADGLSKYCLMTYTEGA